MSKFLKFLFVSTLPMGFISIGVGMLWLYYYRIQEGGFYERMIAFEGDWVGSHFLLSLGSILVFPAALVLYQLVKGNRGQLLAEISLVMALFGGFFIGGQYAIDFIMPIIAKAGGAAHTAHQNFFRDPVVDTMFYGLSELASLSLLLATIALVWSKAVDLKYGLVLLGLFLVVIVGSAMDIPLLARPAFIILGLSFIPVARLVYQK